MADIYCAFCQAPINYYNSAYTITNINEYKKILIEIYNEIKKVKIKKKRKSLEMLWYYRFAFNNIFDGIPFDELNDFEYSFFKKLVDNSKKYKPILLHTQSKYKWLNNITLIHNTDKNIKIARSDDFAYLYDNKNNKYDCYIDGYCVHTDCLKVFEKKYGDIFYYSNLKFKSKKTILEKSKCNDFNKINKYYSNIISNGINAQFFEWLKFFYCKEDSFILESPLKNKKKKERMLNYNIINFNKKIKNPSKKTPIKKPIKKTSSKDKSNRPSPSQSATLFKVGTKKKGNDGNIWIIKKNKNGVNRWSKV